MELITKKQKVFDLKNISINDMFICENKLTKERKHGLVWATSYNGISFAYFEPKKTSFGMDGHMEEFEIEPNDLDDWELKKVEPTGEITPIDNILIEAPRFYYDAGQFVILENLITKEKYHGIISYATGTRLTLLYVTGEYEQSETHKLNIPIKEESNWVGKILHDIPFLNKERMDDEDDLENW